MKYDGNLKDLHKVSGIYKILCLANGRFYVGSSTNLYQRYFEHRGDLRRGSHKAVRMRNSWNKYGENAFVFEVLERCDVCVLMQKEQHYLDSLRPIDPKIGFNTCPVAGTNVGRPVSQETRAKISSANKKPCSESKKEKIKLTFRLTQEERINHAVEAYGKEYSLVSPSGEIVTGRGYEEFCRKHGLSPTTVSRLMSGELLQVSGWTKTGTSKTFYRFRDPFGRLHEIPVRCLKDFARNHNLSHFGLYKVWSKKITHHKGWCHADHESHYVTLVNDVTQQEIVTCRYNLGPFRREYCPEFKTRAIFGERNCSAGWRVKNKEMSKCP